MDDMDDQKHGSLLIKLKKTVQGLLAGQSAQGVWSTYGGLKRVCLDTEAILCHGLKGSQDGSESDIRYWNFIQGLKWLCPSMAAIINKLTKKRGQGQTVTLAGQDWLQESVQEHSLVRQLDVLIGHKEHLYSFYHSHAFLRQPKYVDAMKICFKAIELNKPALLSDIDPQLLKQPNQQASTTSASPSFFHQHPIPQRVLRQGSLQLTPFDGQSLRPHSTASASRRDGFHRVSSFGGMGSKHSQLLEVNYPNLNGSNLSLVVDPAIGFGVSATTRPYKSLSEPKTILAPGTSSLASSSPPSAANVGTSQEGEWSSDHTSLHASCTASASSYETTTRDDFENSGRSEVDGSGESGSQQNLTSLSDSSGLLVYDDIIVDPTSTSPRDCDVIIPHLEDRAGPDSRLLSCNADDDVVDEDGFNEDVVICRRGAERKEGTKIRLDDDDGDRGGGGRGGGGGAISERTFKEEMSAIKDRSSNCVTSLSDSALSIRSRIDDNGDENILPSSSVAAVATTAAIICDTDKDVDVNPSSQIIDECYNENCDNKNASGICDIHRRGLRQEDNACNLSDGDSLDGGKGVRNRTEYQHSAMDDVQSSAIQSFITNIVSTGATTPRTPNTSLISDNAFSSGGGLHLPTPSSSNDSPPSSSSSSSSSGIYSRDTTHSTRQQGGHSDSDPDKQHTTAASTLTTIAHDIFSSNANPQHTSHQNNNNQQQHEHNFAQENRDCPNDFSGSDNNFNVGTHDSNTNSRRDSGRNYKTMSLSTSAPTSSILSSTTPPHHHHHHHHHHHQEEEQQQQLRQQLHIPLTDPLATPLHPPPSPSAQQRHSSPSTNNNDPDASDRPPKAPSLTGSTGNIYTPPSLLMRAGSLEPGSNPPTMGNTLPRSTIRTKPGHKRWVSDTSTIQVQRSSQTTPTNLQHSASHGVMSRKSGAAQDGKQRLSREYDMIVWEHAHLDYRVTIFRFVLLLESPGEGGYPVSGALVPTMDAGMCGVRGSEVARLDS